MRKYILAIALAIPLSSCAVTSPVTQLLGGTSIAEQAPITITTAKKALILFHYTYNGVSDALTLAAQPGGVLHGKDAISAKYWYNKAGDALDIADKAAGIADAQGVMDALKKAQEFVSQASDLINK